MITLILLSCFTILVSAVPVHPNVLPPLLSQRGTTQAQAQVQPIEATNQKPESHTLAPLSPSVNQPQPGVPQQLGPQGGPQLVPSPQHYIWSPLGDNLMIIPLQPSIRGSQPANQPALPQQPLIFPPYGYFPLFSLPHRNQFSPYGFPTTLEAPLPQTPANQPPNSPVLPAETPAEAAAAAAPQPVQQQQMAAKMSQLGAYVPTVLTNLPTGAVQTVSQAAGLTNVGQAGVVPTVVTSSSGVPQAQGLASTGPQPNTNCVPAALERAAQEVVTVQTPVQPALQPTQGNLV
ncbi:DNA translocase FtsK-like isoform X3 [Toxotes jaculatrix]|uniref:DNA translocase FtsK-like isoform X3 n=1 Tax=Toxotes jaculatrix TaxID=941984 RepID=UPI001B3A89B2|nr:DNA translocase FtsK-like isoform X3 [Toxotes jaculatrix]